MVSPVVLDVIFLAGVIGVGAGLWSLFTRPYTPSDLRADHRDSPAPWLFITIFGSFSLAVMMCMFGGGCLSVVHVAVAVAVLVVVCYRIWECNNRVTHTERCLSVVLVTDIFASINAQELVDFLTQHHISSFPIPVFLGRLGLSRLPTTPVSDPDMLVRAIDEINRWQAVYVEHASLSLLVAEDQRRQYQLEALCEAVTARTKTR